MKSFAIYFHIPYCLHKCPYCDFNTYAVSNIPEEQYVEALLKELDFRASLSQWHAREVQTIYFGGGTPSLFSVASISRLISGVCRHFPVAERVEVSLEANPGRITKEYLADLNQAGVNRLSIGLQSFNQETLQALGRTHQVNHSEQAVRMARQAGFLNVSIDLIYAAPKQTLDDLQFDLERAIQVDPDHISAYGLTIEKGTPFFTSAKKGLLQLPKEDQVIDMMKLVNSFLPVHFFDHYEISNFSKPGYEARHNLAYWQQVDYLGLGAGAHSYCSEFQSTGSEFGERWSNFALPKDYINSVLSNGNAESWRDSLSREDAMFEFFFLGLRKIKGVNTKQFKSIFGLSVEKAYGPKLEFLTEEGLLVRDQGNLRLSEGGLLLADSVIEEFMAPLESVLSVANY